MWICSVASTHWWWDNNQKVSETQNDIYNGKYLFQELSLKLTLSLAKIIAVLTIFLMSFIPDCIA